VDVEAGRFRSWPEDDPPDLAAIRAEFGEEVVAVVWEQVPPRD
jgi:hypothetical protein